MRPTLYFACSDLVRSVKDDRYKLIEYRSPEGLARTPLFDLAHDPLAKYDCFLQAKIDPSNGGMYNA